MPVRLHLFSLCFIFDRYSRMIFDFSRREGGGEIVWIYKSACHIDAPSTLARGAEDQSADPNTAIMMAYTGGGGGDHHYHAMLSRRVTELIRWSWLLLEKSSVVHLLNKFLEILCNPKVHYCVHKSSPLVLSLCQINLAYTTTSYLSKIRINTILSMIFSSSENTT
jgi:hypothetical protein